ncbi:hypothetical protein [Cupriavidus taiwanensis]|uniref:Putative integrase/recombinase n=1 Tax=Cupriavidus taiwanensis TaxID=164546 RepID=A0A375JHH1_9BURK|nr:hypothetical protein [Cupriavidus taiwanensis]SPS03056.1 putative integrase/recombinase [Cupriavidus taiwanensis]
MLRLIGGCEAQGLGPLSDLTRQLLLAYRQALQQGAASPDGRGDCTRRTPLADTTRTRAGGRNSNLLI